jgi:methionyl-tRNA formyltransferase
LKNELDKNLFEHPLKINFRYTTFNLNPQQMIEIGAEEINVKDEEIIDSIIKEYDLVFSLHCKQIFPKRLVENVCCINFHPGLNPYNRGWYPQAFSIINGLPAGSTIHLMDAEVDHGEIIAQKEVEIKVSDTSFEVYRKVIEAEKDLIHKNIFNIIEGIFSTTKPKQEGNYNGIRDYNTLCELNLQSTATFSEHLNILRATTHGNFKNAYFIDENGKKYFVRIIIDEAT